MAGFITASSGQPGSLLRGSLEPLGRGSVKRGARTTSSASLGPHAVPIALPIVATAAVRALTVARRAARGGAAACVGAAKTRQRAVSTSEEVIATEMVDASALDKQELDTAVELAEDFDAEPEPKGEGLPQDAAVVILGLVTVLWGAQHATIKATLDTADPLDSAVLNLVRFALAALCFSPWLPPFFRPGRRRRRVTLEWRAGLELGFWLFLGFTLQVVGLLYTTAQRSGLLLYLNVKLVPFFAAVIFGRSVPLSAWGSAAVALFGTILVAGDGAGGVPPNAGDFLSLCAAAASAMFILRLETFAPRTEPKALNAVGMLSVAALNVPWTLLVGGYQLVSSSGGTIPWSSVPGSAVVLAAEHFDVLVQGHFLAILYLGVVTTAFTNWLQAIGQQRVPATTASAIYAMDPLWGCLFAYLWLGEVLGPQGLVGCAVLFGVWAYQFVSVYETGKPIRKDKR